MRLGIDILQADELDRLVERAWFTRYFFAETELYHASTLTGERRREFLAGCFAGKEAVLKVLGTGLFDGVAPRDIALGRTAKGAPTVTLRASAARAAGRARVRRVTVSITHKRGLVAAVAAGW
jgi:holo-[acyl-carrier protein] synthase